MTDSGTIFKEEWKNEVACYSHGMADSDGMPWTWDAKLQECTTLEQKQQSTCEAGDGIWFSHGNSSNVPSFCVKNAQLIQRQGEFEQHRADLERQIQVAKWRSLLSWPDWG